MTTKNIQLNKNAYTLISAVSYGFLENTTGDIVEYVAATGLPPVSFKGHVLRRDDARWWELKSGESLYAKTRRASGVATYTE